MGENWDSEGGEQERSVAAAGVMGEEEEEPGGRDPRAPGIGILLCFLCLADDAGCVFTQFDYFWCESRISLGANDDFLYWGVGLLPLSPWGTADRKRSL